MNNTKVILYDSLDIYKILDEQSNLLNFKLEKIDEKSELFTFIKKKKNSLVISKIDIEVENKLILDILPINFFTLIEKINLKILKINFSNQSNVKFDKYSLNLNTRTMSCGQKKIKLTEQEVKILLYLIKFNKPKRIEELQKDIWEYSLDLETHTVETHIHRLRKKLLGAFKDNVIYSNKEGYHIK